MMNQQSNISPTTVILENCANFVCLLATLITLRNRVSHRGHNCISSALTILDNALTS